ncbi:hypothetical protein D3C80_1564810 [compost metagenome]
MDGGAGGKRDCAVQHRGLVGDASSNHAGVGQPALAQLHGEAMELVAVGRLRFKLVRACEGNSGTVD